MAELIIMPKLGFDMQEGQLINWTKQVGDTIGHGDILAEIESDKATIEVEVFQEGTLLELLVPVNSMVPVGSPIAVIGAPGEQYDLAALGVKQVARQAQPTPQPATAGAPARAASENGGGAPAVSVPSTNGSSVLEGGRVKASPLARKMAENMGINITEVSGSGPGGRIVRSDIEAFQQHMGAAPAIPAAAPAAPAPRTQVAAGEDDEVLSLSRMRTRIAERMVESKTTVPHFYVTSEIDMEPIMKLRQEINARLEKDGIKVSVNDMLVKAAALTLKEFTNLNASFGGDSLIRHKRINVGIAVAVPGGLLNVVSQDADKRPLAQMAVSHKEMIERAREGKVKPEDLEGETFAVSNLGPYDVENFVAIINPPGAAILAVGTARQVPIVNAEGHLAVGWRMKATLSADHRVTDGAEAAQFMQRFKQIVEDPFRLLI